MNTTRIDWIDRMKAVCILVVMLVHLEAGQGGPRWLPWLLGRERRNKS